VTPEFLVRDIMTSPAASLPSTASLLDAALLIRRTGFRHIPVLEGAKLLGVITDGDVNRLAPSRLRNITPDEYNSVLENTLLESVMSRNLVTVSEDTPVVEAVGLLYAKKLGCLPVIAGERLIGIVTVTDLLGLLHQVLGGKVLSAFEVEDN
jgi:acetoin utilization protein AcuB